MANGLKLEGQRFGHLTVLKKLDERENRYVVWLCRCDCGNEIKVNTRHLMRGTVKDCGCIPENSAKRGPVAEDLTGRRFGKLVAVKKLESKNGRTRWECRCDCGNMHISTAHSLKAGKCTSCGCGHYVRGRGITDISGQRFGRLTALYHTDKRSKKGSVFWHCRCDCGNEVDVTEDGLLHGNYRSCGCLRQEIWKELPGQLHMVDGTCVEMLEKRKHRSDNTSGFRGVYQLRNGKYRATIGFKGKRFYIGTFVDYQDAVQARQEAESTILIGLFLVKAGGALIENMAILFAIGVGVGMSEKNDGTGGIAALASWLMLTTLLSTGFVTTIMPSIADSATKTLAFDKIANPFIGILAGIIGSTCYNKFKSTKLPDWLSFFSGKRCVAIIAGVVSIIVSAVLLFVWPLLFSALVALGKAVAGMDVVGAGIYAFLNRLLIPTGLHHALNNVFWFDTIGLGDLQHFWAGETSADVSWSLGMYMSGFFPCMMFGIPGAALAMVRCAKPAKKKVAIGLVASAAICAFICGVTEPFEFGFMFLAPGLYVIYALLYGIFTMITVALGFRAGFSFSAGAMDLLFSSSLPAAQKTLLILPLGIAAFIVFYVVFLFAIKKFDLKTPGREDDDDLEAEKNIELANDDYTAIAAKILEGCGGKENITSIDNCITRLRLEVKDITAVNDKVIKSAGVAGVIKPGKTSVQVIIGTKVQFVADAFSALCK